MVNKPQIIFADEPTGNLDTKIGDQIFDLLSSLARSNAQTLVYVTHDPRYAKLADRVLTILDGEMSDEKPNLP
jgi:putative ABC transport system ATP-binding protein